MDYNIKLLQCTCVYAIRLKIPLVCQVSKLVQNFIYQVTLIKRSRNVNVNYAVYLFSDKHVQVGWIGRLPASAHVHTSLPNFEKQLSVHVDTSMCKDTKHVLLK